MNERYYWLGFALCPGVGPKRFGQLLSHFGSAEAAWIAPITQIELVVGQSLALKFAEYKNSFDLEKYLEKMTGKGVWFVSLLDESYPKLLKRSHNPPFVLFGKGNQKVLYTTEGAKVSDQVERFIGMVGTRRISSYGMQVTEAIGSGLTQAGFCLVSGLAMGVDALVHKTALENRGETIAVLGCGVDCCTPQENMRLYDEILSQGSAIVSEYPLGAAPTKGSFPSRNRIIAGLSQAVVVTEGASDSGALITAGDAFKDQRKVFAVPGPITSNLSRGPNELLRRGALIATSVEDILKELDVSMRSLQISAKKITGETADEQVIIDLLTNEELTFDELVRMTLFDSPKMNMLLSMMEINGVILHTEKGSYTLIQ